MKRNSLPVLLALGTILVAASVGGFTYMQRIYISASQASSDVQIQLQWVSYDADHVAIEYDVVGAIHTAYGNYTGCPVRKSLVFNARAQDITGEVYTSCRLVSEAKYSVTQFFYNDFGNKRPESVQVRVGDLVFFSPKENREVSIPVLATATFDLPAQPASNITSLPNEVVRGPSGIDLSVERADFTPRLVKVDACLTLPDNGDWGIDAQITMDGQAIPIDYWEIPNYNKDPNIFESNKRCFTFLISNVPDFRNMKPGDISFVVQKVYRNMPDCVDGAGFVKIRDELANYGVRPQPDTAGNYCFSGDIVNKLSPEDNAYLFGYIAEALKEEVPGPLRVVIK